MNAQRRPNQQGFSQQSSNLPNPLAEKINRLTRTLTRLSALIQEDRKTKGKDHQTTSRGGPMLSQLITQVRDEWGVGDVNRELQRYSAEHFRSALKELQGLDPAGLVSPAKLLLKTVRGLRAQYYRDQGVNPSLLEKMPGGGQDESPNVAVARSVPWRPMLGPAVRLSFVPADRSQTPVTPQRTDSRPLLCVV